VAPAETLRRFIVAMHEWELEAERLRDAAMCGPHEVDPQQSEDVNKSLMQRLQEIWRTFVEPRGDSRGLTFSTPPEYSPDERILSVRKTRSGVEIVTEQPQSEYVSHRFLYKLFEREGRWWLRNEKWIIDPDDDSREEWFL
jgi:hypothetical protein